MTDVGMIERRVHLTTNAVKFRAHRYEDETLGTVIGDVECQCGGIRAVLGHFTTETMVTCHRCGKTIAVVDPESFADNRQ